MRVIREKRIKDDPEVYSVGNWMEKRESGSDVVAIVSCFFGRCGYNGRPTGMQWSLAAIPNELYFDIRLV